MVEVAFNAFKMFKEFYIYFFLKSVLSDQAS